MNFSLTDSLLGRQRCRQWTPLVTQQFRLRHVHQIFGFNLPPPPQHASYYFTLHQTSMSAPFYTSERVGSVNPKWPELDQRNMSNLAASAVVVRIWRHAPDDADSILATWGVNLSGLVYLGNKLAEIQPKFFAQNAVIFCTRGGYFTSHRVVSRDGPKPPPFSESLNLAEDRKIFRRTTVQALRNEVRCSYNISKLRRLHSLQVTIKNKSLDVQSVRDKIEAQCGADGLEKPNSPEHARNSSPSNIRYAPQLLTMNSLNKMLEEKPTKMQRKEMIKVRNEIEVAQFRSKLLSQERDKKSALIRRFKHNLKELVDKNEEKDSDLMQSYYSLSKETEKLRDLRKNIGHHQETFLTLHSQLYHRRKQLMQQLLFIYPIQQVSEKKYTIHGIHLPNSDILSDCSDAGVSVALGYVTHVLLMCSTFLQVPLRYPLTHYGSRSFITDNISHVLPEREKDFPLFTKGKDKIQFTYAVYLLNKNIAQLRWLLYMHTPELRATLPNLLTLLQGKESREVFPLVVAGVEAKADMDGGVPSEREQLESSRGQEPSKKYASRVCKSSECGPGLSEILAIPEAFLNKQISSDSFKSYANWKRTCGDSRDDAPIVVKEGLDGPSDDCDTDGPGDESIEQGTDPLDLSLDASGGVAEAEGGEIGARNDGARLKNGLSGESVAAVQSIESPLTARTDALLNTKSFNLVRPKSSL